MQRPEIILAHQACNAMFAAGFTSLSKIEKDTRGTINAMTGSEGGPDQSQEPGILQGPI
jgi:hypothetical protein